MLSIPVQPVRRVKGSLDLLLIRLTPSGQCFALFNYIPDKIVNILYGSILPAHVSKIKKASIL